MSAGKLCCLLRRGFAVDANLIERLEVEPFGMQLVCTMSQAAAHSAQETVWLRLMQLRAKVLLGCIKESPLTLHGRLVLEVVWALFLWRFLKRKKRNPAWGGGDFCL